MPRRSSHSTPPHIGWSLCGACVAIICIVVPITAAAQPALLRLPTQLPAEQLSGKTLYPASSLKWSAAVANGEMMWTMAMLAAITVMPSKWTNQWEGGEGWISVAPVVQIFVSVSSGIWIRIAYLYFILFNLSFILFWLASCCATLLD